MIKGPRTLPTGDPHAVLVPGPCILRLDFTAACSAPEGTNGLRARIELRVDDLTADQAEDWCLHYAKLLDIGACLLEKLRPAGVGQLCPFYIDEPEGTELPVIAVDYGT